MIIPHKSPKSLQKRIPRWCRNHWEDKLVSIYIAVHSGSYVVYCRANYQTIEKNGDWLPIVYKCVDIPDGYAGIY